MGQSGRKLPAPVVCDARQMELLVVRPLHPFAGSLRENQVSL